ncbi:hypothetical protein BDV96DRAFT_678024 [Lophiotrema nucula]|uniref:Uncharacterized protein n=1 Tax=Lophiotrema nucula TaxID=690887 RepID=A0A6A5YED8_9PLEO|nr:hypothetical protein BDV96DRAFT_678024 [Lophiotrema nucula]
MEASSPREKKRKHQPLKHYGRVLGAFQIPICENPNGEAISSVRDNRSFNFPCLCGNAR